MENILKNFLEIIGNFIDAYTVAFFEIDNDYLKLKLYFSLNDNLKKNVKIKIGESIIGWIAKHKKPVNIKGDTLSHKILQIYDKEEDIKTYFVLPVENKGVLYIDSKRSYSITEKYQRILIYCAKFFSKLILFEEKNKDFKNVIKKLEFVRKLDYKNFINYVCDYFKFEYGAIFKREGEDFVIINSNSEKEINLSEDGKIGVLLKKIFNKPTYLDNDLIIPFLSQNLIIGGFILFNANSKSKKIIDEIENFKKIFELKFFEEVFKFEAFKKYENILTIENFLIQRKKFSSKSYILIKISNFYKLIDNFHERTFLISFKKILNNLEKIFDTKLFLIKISPNSYALAVDKLLFKKIKNFIEKNFKNTYLKINNQNVNLKLQVSSFYEDREFLRFIFS